MRSKLSKKLRVSWKQWFLSVVWSRIRTHRVLSLTLLVLAVAILFCAVLWCWMCEHQELAAGFLTSLVLAGGLYFAYQQLTLMKKTAQAELINNMSQYWDSRVMRNGRKALREIDKKKLDLYDEVERCMNEDFDGYLNLTIVGGFFEEMGNLARNKAIDLHLIEGRFRSSIINFYEVYKVSIEKSKPKQPTIYEHFQWLTEEIQKIKM